jgi:hypothetical protein
MSVAFRHSPFPAGHTRLNLHQCSPAVSHQSTRGQLGARLSHDLKERPPHLSEGAVAGGVCRHAKEELGPAGLPWTKAAWEEGLRAAMTGLEALAGTADARLQQGFEKVLMSIKRAHLEGLQQPANASRGVQRTAASPAPASRAAASQALPQAGGASRKARKARVHLSSYLFGDKGE